MAFISADSNIIWKRARSEVDRKASTTADTPGYESLIRRPNPGRYNKIIRRFDEIRRDTPGYGRIRPRYDGRSSVTSLGDPVPDFRIQGTGKRMLGANLHRIRTQPREAVSAP